MKLIPLLQTLYRAEILIETLQNAEQMRSPVEEGIASAVIENIHRLLSLSPEEIAAIDEYRNLSDQEKRARLSQSSRQQPSNIDSQDIALRTSFCRLPYTRWNFYFQKDADNFEKKLSKVNPPPPPKAFANVDDATWKILKEQVEFSEISEQLEGWLPPSVDQLLLMYACQKSVNNSYNEILFSGRAILQRWDIYFLRERVRVIAGYKECVEELAGSSRSAEIISLIQGEDIIAYEKSLEELPAEGGTLFATFLSAARPGMEKSVTFKAEQFPAIFAEARSTHPCADTLRGHVLTIPLFCNLLFDHFQSCMAKAEGLAADLTHPLFSVKALERAARHVTKVSNLPLERKALLLIFNTHINDSPLNYYLRDANGLQAVLDLRTKLTSWRILFRSEPEFLALIQQALAKISHILFKFME